MTIKDYTAAAKRFAKDSRKWGGLDQYKFYTTDGDEWVESSDNANGGLDLSWAFHESEGTIRAEAPQRFLDQLADLLELGIDEGWDANGLASILDLMR